MKKKPGMGPPLYIYSTGSSHVMYLRPSRPRRDNTWYSTCKVPEESVVIGQLYSFPSYLRSSKELDEKYFPVSDQVNIQ